MYNRFALYAPERWDSMKQRIVILGGGASGMVAAIAAAEHAPSGTEILLLEQNPKLGKKLLATGNGRCNLDNAKCSIDNYFTSNPGIAATMLQHIADLNLQKWFFNHGLFCREAEDGRLYPYSNQAADVVTLLSYWLKQYHVIIHTDCRVTNLLENGSSYTVICANGMEFDSPIVICAMGGNAGPQFGSEGFGIKTAFRLGCQMEPLYPCLVPLKCKREQIATLSGIRVKANATLYDGTQAIHTEIGEIQFTDYGISGIAIMQLTGWLGTQHGLTEPNIQLNLFPQYTETSLTALLFQRTQQMKDASISEFLTGFVHPQVGIAIWNAQHIKTDIQSVASLNQAECAMFAKGLQHWTFTELEHTGWKHAQTTGGGIALQQLEPYSFQLKEKPGLYFVGETIDCAGFCGGYNLHLAFGSGLLAGIHAAQSFYNSIA